MPQNYHLQVRSALHQLSQVLAWSDQLDHSWIAEIHWRQCQLAIAEGFTNAVRHAHKQLPPETPIQIEIEIDPGHIVVRIWDYGPPYDLGRHFHELPEIPDLNAESGRGLYLIKQISDQLNYVRVDDQRNCLFMLKYNAAHRCNNGNARAAAEAALAEAERTDNRTSRPQPRH